MEEFNDVINNFKSSLTDHTCVWTLYNSACTIIAIPSDSLKSFTKEHKTTLANLFSSCISCQRCVESIWESIGSTDSAQSLNPNLIYFLQSYRLLSNKLQDIQSYRISSTEFSKCLIYGIPRSLVSTFAANFSSFPDHQNTIIERIVSDEQFCALFIASLEGNDSLFVCGRLLRLYKGKSEDIQSRFIIVVELLIRRCLHEQVGCQYILDEIVLKRPYDRRVAEVIVQSIINKSPLSEANSSSMSSSDNSLLQIVDIVGRVWGSKVFISRGDQQMMEYITNVLVVAIRHTTADQLNNSIRSYDNISLLAILTNGVSMYLDLSDKTPRLCGMRVAVEFAKVLGHTLHFDELVDTQSNTGKEKLENSHESVQVTSDANDDNDSNTSSEFEAYDLDEPSSHPSNTYYLRNCLEMLQKSEASAETHDQHLNALTSIPNVVATHPYDARDLIIPLTKELLRMQNTFNIENFSTLHEKAMKAILTAYPALAMPIVVWSITSPDSFPLSTRLSTISLLISVVHDLAGIEVQSLTDTPKLSQNIPKCDSVSNQAITSSSSSENFQSSKTIVKRPRKLALSHKRTKIYRNEFSAIAQITYFPILQTLIKSLSVVNGTIPIDNALKSISSGVDHFPNPFLVIKQPAHQEPMQGDGFDTLLPAKLFQALIACTRCSRNTIHKNLFVENTLKIAIWLKDSPIISIRRGALQAILCCMELWNPQTQSSREYTNDSTQSTSALEGLMDITSLNPRAKSSLGNLSDVELNEAVLEAVDWAVSTIREEPDSLCRALKYEIIRYGVRAIEDEPRH